jgi:hypothetical protein
MTVELTYKLTDGTVVAVEVDSTYGLNVAMIDPELPWQLETTDTNSEGYIYSFTGDKTTKEERK